MTGKEALRILCECANGEKKLLFSDSLDLEQIISKRLEKLEKLEKAFEILKDKLAIEPMKDEKECWFYFKNVYSNGYTDYVDLNNDEYELLEELMKCEEDK